MKNLKKVLALVVALTMVLGTVAFASFTDVAEENDAYTAVQTLSSLSILNGYEDGTFKPEGDITRAEFCAVVCRALGLEGSANGAKGATQFTDVAADHWASGYINLAAGAKIVNGMGDGTFQPESNVTFEQAVKMLVVALGYEPMAAQKGGYPAGYLVVANTYGMTDGVKLADQAAAATRGVVAQLTYNALDIPVMKQVGFGTNTEYAIMDGSDYDYESLLSNLGVAKLEGVITATPMTAEDCEAGTAVYTFSEWNDDQYWTDKADKDDKSKFEEIFYVAEGVDVEAYFGASTIAYVRELSRNKFEIIAIMANEESEMVTISWDQVQDETTDTVVEYLPTPDSRKNEKIRLEKASDLTIIANNATVNNKTFKEVGADLAKKFSDIEITFIENDGDNNFDMIIFKAYVYGLIETVEADKDRFTVETADNTYTYYFDFEDETISNKIVNADGEAITLADFAEGDVVAVLSQGEKRRDFTWIEVINLGQNFVEGRVDQKDTDNDVVYIDGTEYEYVTGLTFELKDEGVFYLNKSGKIFKHEVSSAAAGNYAYILEAYFGDSGFDKAWQLKLLTKDAGVVVYNVDDDFEVDGVDLDGDKETYTGTDDAAKKQADAVAKIAALVKEDGVDYLTNPKSRLITFDLNSSNYITEIDFVKAANIKAIGYKADGSFDAKKEYNADTQSIASTILENDTVIFNVPETSANKAFATDINYLVDEGEYAGYAIKSEADGEYDCFLVLKGSTRIDLTSDIAVVSSRSDYQLEDGEDAIKVRYYIANEDEEKELIIVKEKEISEPAISSTKIEDVKAGALIMFSADENGIATSYVVLATIADDQTWALKDGAYDFLHADEDNEIFVGTIYDHRTANNGRAIMMNKEDGEEIVVRADTSKYTVAKKGTKTNIIVADWQGEHVDKIKNAEDGKATWFVARTYNGIVTEFVTNDTRSSVK